MSELVVRVAARGDGVTESGRHVPLAAPGDRICEDGTIAPGPGRQEPPCSLFPECGGCQLQHLTDGAYSDYCIARVAGALAQQGIDGPVLAPHLSPPRSRRRATLRAVRSGSGILLGFNAAGSNRIVDMAECHILDPRLFALIAPLRRLLGGLLPRRGVAEVQLTLADQGVDLLLKGVEPQGLDAELALTRFAEDQNLARLSLDQGYGAETRYAPVPVTATLGGTPVGLPVGAFLQATADGERALVKAVREATAGASRVADLFAGLGTFALSLDSNVTAAEAARDASAALEAAGRTSGRAVRVEHRDLYRRPLDPTELASFDAVVLDPPRAGAQEQVRHIAGSSVPRLAYVSCNPATFARDCAILIAGGYRLDWVRPVGQFRWSTHVELAAALSR